MPSPLTGQLGQRWETTVIMVKSYAAMGGLHGAIDAARELRAESIDPKHISKIDITVGDHRLQTRLVDARAPA